MNNTLKDIDPISEALSHAGESSAVSPTLARMFQRELTSHDGNWWPLPVVPNQGRRL